MHFYLLGTYFHGYWLEIVSIIIEKWKLQLTPGKHEKQGHKSERGGSETHEDSNVCY